MQRLDAREGSSRPDSESSPRSGSPVADPKTSVVISGGGRKDEDPDRPLTMTETFDMIRANFERIEGTRREFILTVALVVLGGAGVWVLLTLVIPWSGGILQSIQDVLALRVPWPTLPPADDSRVSIDRHSCGDVGRCPTSSGRVLVYGGISP